MEEMSPAEVLERAACARCGSLCDDLTLALTPAGPRAHGGACELARLWIEALPASLEPAALVRGQPVTTEEAISASAASLEGARAPAVALLPGLSVEAAREAVRLALEIPAALVPLSGSGGAARGGIDAPELTATLGEVRGAADLVVFWRADPARELPRFLERLGLDGPLPGGRRRETILVEDAARLSENRTALHAQGIVEIPPGRGLEGDVDLALRLRLLLEREERHEEEAPAARLASRIESASFAHFFLGARAAGEPLLADALGALAARLRRRVRIGLSGLPGPGNCRGILEAATWLSGAPGPWLPTPQEALDTPAAPSGSPGSPGSAASRASAGSPGAAAPEILWLPGAAACEEWLRPPRCDLALLLGLAPELQDLPPPTPLERLTLGSRLDPAAIVSFRAPALDPRLSATLIRSDGVASRLCGGAPGPEDPAVAILRGLRSRLAELRREVRP